jgi:ankyrin repeat protein
MQVLNAEGCSSLMFAAQLGHLKIVTSLCNAGADIFAANDSGSNSLHLAAQDGHTECVRYLLKRGGVSQYRCVEVTISTHTYFYAMQCATAAVQVTEQQQCSGCRTCTAAVAATATATAIH